MNRVREEISRRSTNKEIDRIVGKMIDNHLDVQGVLAEFEREFDPGRPLHRPLLEIAQKSGHEAAVDFIDRQMLIYLKARVSAPGGGICQKGVETMDRESLKRKFVQDYERMGLSLREAVLKAGKEHPEFFR